MTSRGDPYRTLGVAPGASLNDIRSAYRRLAKQYHPDAAGERALPRFLAIQAAYEQLVDGDGRLRARGTSPPGASGTGAPGTGGPGTGGHGAGGRGASSHGTPGDEPWRADPARARASRDAWRARRSGGPAGTAGPPGSSGPSASSPPPGTEWARGDRADGAASGGSRADTDAAGSTSGAGDAGASRGTGESGRSQRRTRRTTRKATPGSTTYDEAAKTPHDPAWSGGAWYGHSSGTYWTINPREYADPRRHGPEYQARARRAAANEASVDGGDGLAPDAPAADQSAEDRDAGPMPGSGPGAAPGPSADAHGGPRESRWEWDGSGPTTTNGGSEGWRTGGWTHDPAEATAGAAGSARGAGAGERRRAAPAGGPWAGAGAGPMRTGAGADPAGADAHALPDLESLARRGSIGSLLAVARRRDVRSRAMLALLAWPPIGYAVGTLLSTVTGCASFSAACPEPLPLLPIAVQPLVIGLLFLAGPAAAVGAFASLVALAVALPVSAILAVGTGPEGRVGAPVLGVFVVVTYLVALGFGARAAWRSGPDTERGSGPEGEPPP